MYLSVSDLVDAFSERALIELSNDTSRATSIDERIVGLAIQYATETIDGYLRSRYALPLDTVPTIVRNIGLQLARYWLYSRRPEGKGLPESVKDTHKQAIRDLEAIQSGKLHLGLPGLTPDDLLPEGIKFKARAPSRLDTQGY